MKRVLLDENLPRKLRRALPGFVVRTVQDEGWTSYRNGQLLRRAEGHFDVLLTADRGIPYQQNLARHEIGLVAIVTVSLRLKDILPAIEAIRDALSRVQPGEVIQVHVSGRRQRPPPPPPHPSYCAAR